MATTTTGMCKYSNPSLLDLFPNRTDIIEDTRRMILCKSDVSSGARNDSSLGPFRPDPQPHTGSDLGTHP